MKTFIFGSLFSLLGVAGLSYYYHPAFIYLLIVILPVVLVGVVDMFQSRQTIRRNFPLFGRLRYVFEVLRPKIIQYFVESDIDGRPINRIHRSVVYQRAKNVRDTAPFGTQKNVYENGHEWINHSLGALAYEDLEHDLRIDIGGPDCKMPYSSSILNISAMSYGALSKQAILSLNWGALAGGFSHNTGEGGISKWHLQNGGDLVWQIGTGYFGCRDEVGKFCGDLFKEKATEQSVRMIEIKLSQGAKPGHGGILPAAKNNAEIAKIRNVKEGTDVISPPTHTAFSSPIELCKFIKTLRDLSGGKPIGFKLCAGRKSEFIAICKAMQETGVKPDFITVDGAEGGTGAAPLEFSDSIGMPLKDGLAFIVDALVGFDFKKDIKVFASGKAITGFDIIKFLAIGADGCNAARAMMLALGCIQALECNSNTCPTGIATQNPGLARGLVPEDKYKRISSFHGQTVRSVSEILGAAGMSHPDQLERHNINRRVSSILTMRYDQIYPEIETGSFLGQSCPKQYKYFLEKANPNHFGHFHHGNLTKLTS